MAEVFFNHLSELATISNTFAVDGVATDPATVSLAVTDPDAATVTYTYAAGQISRTSAGVYTRDISCASTAAGQWSALWVGTGTASDVEPVTWTTFATALNRCYTSLALVRNAIGATATDRDELIMGAILAGSRGIDDHCERRFWLDAATSTRRLRIADRLMVDDDGDEILVVDDVATETGLVLEVGDGTTWTTVDADDYETDPDNAIADGKPITGLRRVSGCWSSYRRARVTARYGWPVLPHQVTQAGLIQAQRLYKRKDSPEGVLGSSEWGAVRVARVDPDVQNLLRKLVRVGR